MGWIRTGVIQVELEHAPLVLQASVHVVEVLVSVPVWAGVLRVVPVLGETLVNLAARLASVQERLSECILRIHKLLGLLTVRILQPAVRVFHLTNGFAINLTKT